MQIVGIISLSIALAIDAMIVSMALSASKTVTLKKDKIKCALVFGVFQGVMPLIGYTVTDMLVIDGGITVAISFVLLMFLGCKIIIEALRSSSSECENETCLGESCCKDKCDLTGKAKKIGFGLLLISALSTSIDALAAGPVIVVFGFNVVICVISIALITFVLSYAGFSVSKILRKIPSILFEILAGLVLIVMAIFVIIK